MSDSVVWVRVDLETRKWLHDRKMQMPVKKRSVNEVVKKLIRDAQLVEEKFEEIKSAEAQEEFKN